jgi:tetratricopeptide (TPR) repeat protein
LTDYEGAEPPLFFIMSLKKIEQLINTGEYDLAEAQTKRLAINEIDRLAILATISYKRGDHQRAEVEYLRVLEKKPENPIAAGNLASLYQSQKKIAKSLPYARVAYEKNKANASSAKLYAAALADADKHSEAAKIIEPFTKEEKPDPGMLLAYAAVLRGDLRHEESIAVLERAQTLYPENEEAQMAFADAYAEIEPRLAVEQFRKAIEKKSDSVTLKWNASFVELRLRNFESGWSLYEFGLTDKVGKIGRPLPAQVKSIPMINELTQIDPRKWTLFTAEQGLGDQILFLSALREAIEVSPKSALIGEDRMVELLQRSFPEIPVYTYGFASGLSRQAHRVNGVFPIGSLMKHFRCSAENFNNNKRAYIIPNKNREEKYRDILRGKLGNQPLIGISWRGGYWERQRKTKSFEFDLFMRLMKESNCRFISLQYGDVTEEKKLAAEVKAPVTFIDGIDFKKDIDGWVALAAACDRIISVSTALVHFAGAMEKPVDLLLGDYQAPFIWGLEEGESLPYSSVTIHRKSKDESIGEYFERLRNSLL